jgi:hypothetical protein
MTATPAFPPVDAPHTKSQRGSGLSPMASRLVLFHALARYKKARQDMFL